MKPQTVFILSLGASLTLLKYYFMRFAIKRHPGKPRWIVIVFRVLAVPLPAFVLTAAYALFFGFVDVVQNPERWRWIVWMYLGLMAGWLTALAFSAGILVRRRTTG